jgi:hypothetical protein
VPTLLDGLASVSTLALGVEAARTRLRREPGRSAPALEALVRKASTGHKRSQKALLSCAIALAQDDGEAWVGELAGEADAQGLAIAAAILKDAKPHRTSRRLPDPHFAGSLLASFLDVTPTHQRSESSRAVVAPPPSVERDRGISGRWFLLTRHLMGPLLMHPDPFVVRRLLAARLLRLPEALVIASRRPTSPSIVRELVTAIRWIGRSEVREALVANPFVSTRIAGLSRGAVHPLLTRLASSLARIE